MYAVEVWSSGGCWVRVSTWFVEIGLAGKEVSEDREGFLTSRIIILL